MLAVSFSQDSGRAGASAVIAVVRVRGAGLGAADPRHEGLRRESCGALFGAAACF